MALTSPLPPNLRVAVVIPALDEEATIADVVQQLPQGVQVVVVDNGSADATAERAASAGATVLHEAARGYGSAVQAGLAHLAQDPPDVVAILDADLADDPATLGVLVGPIAQDEADFVLADRSRTSEPGALTPPQRWGNALALAGIAAITGHRYQDLGPFRALRWSSLQQLQMSDPTWGWNVEMQIKAVRQGLRVVEIPLRYRCRHAGQSKISGTVIGTVRAGYRILLTLAQYARP